MCKLWSFFFKTKNSNLCIAFKEIYEETRFDPSTLYLLVLNKWKFQKVSDIHRLYMFGGLAAVSKVRMTEV